MRTVEMEALPDADQDSWTIGSGAPRRPLPLWQTALLVAAGGAVGASIRFVVTLLLPSITTPTLIELPRATLLVNIFGCLGLGILYSVLEHRPDAPPWIRPFLGIGALGTFTTFSLVTLEGASMMGANFPGMASMYAALTLVGALGGVSLGILMGPALIPPARHVAAAAGTLRRRITDSEVAYTVRDRLRTSPRPDDADRTPTTREDADRPRAARDTEQTATRDEEER